MQQHLQQSTLYAMGLLVHRVTGVLGQSSNLDFSAKVCCYLFDVLSKHSPNSNGRISHKSFGAGSTLITRLKVGTSCVRRTRII